MPTIFATIGFMQVRSMGIECNPAVLGGKPVVAGTRISVEQVLEHLASGWTYDQLQANFPTLTREAILACLGYASESVKARGRSSRKAS